MHILTKPWWVTRGASTFRAFTYPGNEQFPEKFAKAYGGEALKELEIPEAFLPLVANTADLLSLLENDMAERSSASGMTDALRFKVLVQVGPEWRVFDAGYKTLKEANASAKMLNRVFRRVAVVRERYVEG